jgi:hypothetical protein
MTIDRIDRLLRQVPELRDINSQVLLLFSVQRALVEALPASLAEATSAASLTDGKLMLFANNGAVAAKLRQMTPRILVFLRTQKLQITGIQVQVQVKTTHNPLPRKQISLSGSAAKSISELSARMKPSALKQALDRLSAKADAQSDGDQEPFKRHQSQENQ